MVAWISAGIAGAALIYAVFSNLFERRERKRQFDLERTDRQRQMADEREHREREFELMRTQAAAAAQAREAQNSAYISVDQRQSSGGDQFDRYTFRVTNAGPAMARHIALRIDNDEGLPVVEAAKVDPHVLQSGQSTDIEIAIPRSQRLAALHPVIEWVDPEQNAAWLERGVRKEREVAEPVNPVSRLP